MRYRFEDCVLDVARRRPSVELVAIDLDPLATLMTPAAIFSWVMTKQVPVDGPIKEAVKEAILEGEIPNEYEAAKDFVLNKASKMGLKKV